MIQCLRIVHGVLFNEVVAAYRRAMSESAPASSRRTVFGSRPNIAAMKSATGALVRNWPSSSCRLLASALAATFISSGYQTGIRFSTEQIGIASRFFVSSALRLPAVSRRDNGGLFVSAGFRRRLGLLPQVLHSGIERVEQVGFPRGELTRIPCELPEAAIHPLRKCSGDAG